MTSMIPIWLVILGVINGVCFLFGYVFIIHQQVTKKTIHDFFSLVPAHKKPILIIFAVVFLHILEVQLLDYQITSWINIDFTSTIQYIENGIVAQFHTLWTPGILHFFVIIYIGIYPFTLWFSPLYYMIANKEKAIQTLAYTLLVVYLIAFPFYLFFPVNNVYTTYLFPSALSMVIPTIHQFFYSTTTINNCFPSLHVAMTLVITRAAQVSGNKTYFYCCLVLSALVIFSVIYLGIHWISDVIAGIVLAIFASYMVRYLQRRGTL